MTRRSRVPASRSLTYALFLLHAVALPALAAPAAEPSMALETSKIRPKGERALTPRARPTVKKKVTEKSKGTRQTRVNLEIPERLRAILASKLERRIARDIATTKALRKEALGLLTKFAREADPKSNEMPEALLRIGELEWEDARDRFLAEFQKWESKPADLRGDPPLPNYERARRHLHRVLTEYKSFREYDLALYVDGCLSNEEGKLEEARGRFDKLVEWFPKSRFIPDAHMARAEYEFTKAQPDYENAFREYEEVLKFKDSELYDLALFKSAWTLWRLGKPDEAARRFLGVFQATSENKGTRAHKSQDEIDELQTEALRNLVAVFVEDERNRAEDMYQFLVKAGGDKFAGKIVNALAQAFFEQSHYERGVEAYRLLLKLEPTNPDAYRFALQIARAHSTMEAWDALAQDYRWILREYVLDPESKKGAKGSAWLSVQSDAVSSAALAEAEQQLREDAVGLHAKAQADKNSRVEFEAAVTLYDLYLSRFSKRRAAYEMYFNLAEIEFYRLENAVRAADAYLACVRIDPTAALSRTALYNALSALEVARAAEFEAAKKARKKQEETPTDKKLTEAMELYVKSYANDEQIPELLFRQGKLYYDYQVYDVAVRQWGLLLEKYPNSKYSLGAGELTLDSFNKSRDYANIETWARRLKTAPAFQASAQQSRLDTLIVGAVFKQGEQLSEKGEHHEAAQAYLRAAKEFPKEERAAAAAVNAEVEARRAGDLETLEVAAELLIKSHKTRPEAAQGVWIAAQTHQEVGLFREAAGYHALIAESFPRFAQHKDAAFDAVLLYTTVGDHDKAIKSGERFKKYYAKDEASDEVTFLMGKAHEKADKKREAAILYERYAKSAKNHGAQIEALVRLAGVSNEERARSSALERAVQTYSQRKGSLEERGKYYAARARYMQGEAFLTRFDVVKIEGDVKQLKARLKQKSELLKKAADTFLSTAEMGVAEWTTAALYQIGFTYESFSKALLNAPPPTSLSEADQELYRQSIEEFVIPIEERSLEAYESGWQKAIELDIYNSWTAKMREALGRLNAELYPPLKELGAELRSRGPAPLPGLIAAPRRGKNGRSQQFLLSDGEGDSAKKATSERDGEAQ